MAPRGCKTWIELSRAAVENNTAALRSFLNPESEFCAVIKANAYGHGQAQMTELLLGCDVTHFAVDSIDEAQMLHEQSPRSTIFILGYTVNERLRNVVEIGAIQTIYDEQSVLELSKWGTEDQPARLSLKIETGLHRQGIGPRGLASLLDAISSAGNRVKLESVGSHFASAEEPGHPMNAFQIEHFEHAILAIEARGFSPKYRHIACSAAAMTIQQSQKTLSRFGVATYGLWSSKETKRHVVLGRQNIELQPVLQLKTRIAQVKDVPPGGAIGYSGTHIANRPIRLAVLPIGYADGIDRALTNKGEVLIRGRRCPIVGNVCMNMIMVDASSVPSVHQDDEVIIIGRDGMHAISADDIANNIGTINYEVVTRLNPLLPRIVW